MMCQQVPTMKRPKAKYFFSISPLELVILIITGQNVEMVCGFSLQNNIPYVHSMNLDCVDRPSFLRNAFGCFFTTASVTAKPISAKAIDFTPSSPFFTGTYQDALDIMYTQRVALDNIASVINDGNIEEANFKLMQLAAQTRMAGTIILDAIQEQISNKPGSNSIILLRYLACQKKLAVLLDLCDECGTSLQSAIKGRLGATAVAQVKILSIVSETKGSYDDFLMDVKTVEDSIVQQK